MTTVMDNQDIERLILDVNKLKESIKKDENLNLVEHEILNLSIL